MTNEELVQAYQNGDKKALEKLIENNKGMIHLVARKYQGYCIATLDIEDLIQEGYIGLIKAAERYDFNNSKKAIFMTYALYWVRQRIGRYGKYKSRKREDVSIYTPIGDDLEIGDTLQEEEDYICKVEDSIYFQELKNEIHIAMKENLTLRECQVLELRFGINSIEMTFNEVGEILEICHQRVRAIEDNSIRKIRNSKWGRMKWLEIKEEKYSRGKM